MSRLNITVPDELYERIEKYRDRLNISRICQEAIGRELAKLELVPEDVRQMRDALSRLGEQKAALERSCFRRGVYDGLEWARQADYSALKSWGERVASNEAVNDALKGPAAINAAEHMNIREWDPLPYGEGWIAGVQQFWMRAKNRL